MLNYPAIPIIVVICYIAITAIKSTKIDSRWYPPSSRAELVFLSVRQCTLSYLTSLGQPLWLLPSFPVPYQVLQQQARIRYSNS